MVLGRMGRSPPLIQERVLYPAHRHLRAGAAGAPASIMLPLAALVSPHRTCHDQVDVVSFAAKFMGLSETGGRAGVGVI